MESKKLILIIDDEPDFLETMRFFLENANFRVTLARTPEEGLQKAREKPDLILLDLAMPGMNGHEVCKRIKEDSATLYIPVIMLTSHDRTLDKVEAFNLGVTDYIGKDFAFEEILARIKAALRQTAISASTLTQDERNKRVMELRKTIDEKNLRTLFQPIISLATKEIIGYEAFTRGPKGTSLESPLDLFSLANEVNMFYELDNLCLSFAAKRAHFIQPQHILFLNADPAAIDQDYFKNLDFLNGSSIKPAQLCIEITERTWVTNFAKLSAELAHFKSQGIRVAVDDVGEGYSSLRAIAELKPEFLKITIDLVRNVNTDSTKHSLVQVIAELAKKINSRLIAEGIETEEEYKTLLSMGIEFGQGYLFARPFEQT